MITDMELRWDEARRPFLTPTLTWLVILILSLVAPVNAGFNSDPTKPQASLGKPAEGAQPPEKKEQAPTTEGHSSRVGYIRKIKVAKVRSPKLR